MNAVQFTPPDNVETLIEFLRYAQIISITDDEDIVIHCPRGIGRPDNWAHANAERIASFNIKTTLRSYKR